MKIIYLHGFNSAYDMTSSKVFSLSEIADVTGITYDTYDTYDTFENIFEFLSEKIEYDSNTIIVGTSLGGFWAATMAKHFKMPSVLINPTHSPHETLKRYVGETYLNYVTGDVKTLGFNISETYKNFQIIGSDESFFIKPLVLLDEGDEILDVEETRKMLNGFKIISFSDGNHRFSHIKESLPEIRKYVYEETNNE